MFWKGLLGYLPVNIVQAVVGILTIVTFTRMLTPAQYGDYALGFSAMTLAHTLMFTWMEAAMARFLARETEAGRTPDLFVTLYRCWLGMGLAFPLIAGLAVWFWPTSADVKLAMAAGLAAILTRSLAKMVQERRRAAGDVRAAALLDIVQTAGGFGLGIVLILFGWGGAAPLAGMGAGAAVCIIFALPAELKRLQGGKFEAGRAKDYLTYGGPVAASLVLAIVLSSTDRFVLAAFLNETTVGVYHAGYSLANRTLDVMFIWLGMAGGPAMIQALERGGRPALVASAKEQAELMIALCLPAAAGVALVAHPLAEVMVGPALREGAAQVTPWITLAGAFAGFTTYYFHQAFTLARRTGLLLAAMAVPAVANLALTLILIPRFGLDGALWATAASYGLGIAASALIGRRVMPLPVPWMTLARAGLATALMAAAVIQVPDFGGALELFAKAAVGGAVYGLVAALLDVAGLRGRAMRFVAARRAGAAA